MTNPASITDVTASIERPLTTDETRVIPTWLDKAWRELQRVVPGIPARMLLTPGTLGYLDHDGVKDVVVAMVERKVRNPEGLRTWGGDDASQTVDAALSSGQIYVSKAERESLLPQYATGDGVFSMELSRR